MAEGRSEFINDVEVEEIKEKEPRKLRTKKDKEKIDPDDFVHTVQETK